MSNNTRNPAFLLARIALINIMAREGTPTSEIAERLGINRSYVIRLTSLSMEPSNDTEHRIAALCGEYTAQLVRMGMGFVTKDDIVTKLAGADGRGVGGGRPRKDAAPKAKAPKAAPKAKAPKAAPKAKAPKAAPKAKAPKTAPKVKAPKAAPKAAPSGRGRKAKSAEQVLAARDAVLATTSAPAPLEDLAAALVGSPDPDTVLAPPGVVR